MIRFDASISNYVFLSDRFNINYNGAKLRFEAVGFIGSDILRTDGETIDQALNNLQGLCLVVGSVKAEILYSQIDRDRARVNAELLPVSGAPGSAAHKELVSKFAGRPGIAL